MLAVLLALAAAGAVGCGDKEEGSPQQGYIETVLSAKDRAEMVACQTQLRNLGVTLTSMAAGSGGKFPASLDALVADGTVSAKQAHCPSRKGKRYVYVAGQTTNAPGDNLLLYEDAPVHGGKCNVLYVNGRVEALTPEQLQAALERTRKALR